MQRQTPQSAAAVAAAASTESAASARPKSPLDPAQPLWVHALVFALLAAVPWVTVALGEDFYVGVATRMLVFALAATALNLVLGFGGLVSFGHAAFVGLGAYTTGVLMQHGVLAAAVAWPAAMLVAALAAAAIGALSLRTRGVYFIMITLAFAQMLYFLLVSLKTWGGDDGLPLPQRNTVPGLDLAQDGALYAVALAALALAVWLQQRVLNAPLGQALQAARENPLRMAALGFPVRRVQWVAFTASGAWAGLAGALLANQAGFVSPSMMAWQQSGLLMVMVILGGVGRLYGPLVGAAVFLGLEEVLSAHTIHWQLGLGLLLLAVVFAAPQGLVGLWRRRP